MARPLRIDYPGAYYHVTCRGNERREIFKDDRDRSVFLEMIEESLEIYGVRLHGYVLMGNHFHLVVETPKGNLSEFMRRFNVSYTGYYNRRHGRVGHLYQGRFKAILVEADSYLLELSRYLHLNPVRVGSVQQRGYREQMRYLEKYKWSSLPGYLSYDRRSPWVVYGEVLGYVGGSRKRYAEFIEDGLQRGYATPWEGLKAQVVLGRDAFWEGIRRKWKGSGQDRREQPTLRLWWKVDPEEVVQKVASYFEVDREELRRKRSRHRDERAVAMEMLYRHCGLRLREVGVWMGGMDYGAVSRERGRLRAKMEHSRQLRRWARDIEERLMSK
ncbi:MAG: transposase [Candidatus Binatia bacterium]